MIMSTWSGILDFSVLTFFAHSGVAEARLYLSSLEGYWKAEDPYFGVKGEAYMVREAPEVRLKVWVPSSRNVTPFLVATEEGSEEIIFQAASIS